MSKTRRYWAWLATLAGLMTALSVAGYAASSPLAETTPAPRPPKPDFAPMKYILGTWHCSTKSSRRPAAATWTTSNALDPSGYWIVGTDHNDGTSWFPYSTNGTDRITYDADSKRWIDTYYDDLGNYGLGWSSGPHGNKIVWNDGYFTPSSDTVSESPSAETWVSPTKRTMHATFTEKSGRVNTVDTVCTKGS